MDNNFLSVRGWWKMAISHLKHSYLNWRVIPCKRKMICVHVVFHHFLNIFWFLDSCLGLIEFSSAWHDNQFFFILTICLLRATMHAIDGLSSRSISSRVRIILKGWPFGPKLFRPFLSKERIMAQKYFREMGDFWSMCLEASIKVIFKYHDLGILFCSLKRFGKFETVASLYAYQIINYQFLQKFIIFCCLIS